jgi:DNA-binding NtrC family response regulator
MEQATILVVEDDAQIRDVLTEHLTLLSYAVVCAASAEEALQRLEETTPDLVLTVFYSSPLSSSPGSLISTPASPVWPQARMIFSPSHSTFSKSAPASRPSCA